MIRKFVKLVEENRNIIIVILIIIISVTVYILNLSVLNINKQQILSLKQNIQTVTYLQASVIDSTSDIIICDDTLFYNDKNVYYKINVPLSQDIQYVIYKSSSFYDIDYSLVLGLIQCESNFNIEAVSSVGCYGLMQLHPKYFPSDLNVYENIEYGVQFLNKCIINCDGDIEAALRTYNHGSDDGDRDYSNKVLEFAENYK